MRPLEEENIKFDLSNRIPKLKKICRSSFNSGSFEIILKNRKKSKKPAGRPGLYRDRRAFYDPARARPDPVSGRDGHLSRGSKARADPA
jgi:hypothetical protein